MKNRAPAPIQITAEQLLVEARERAEQQQPPPPKRHITDPQELAEYRLKSRKEYEDRIRMNRANIGVWLRYAKWEEVRSCCLMPQRPLPCCLLPPPLLPPILSLSHPHHLTPHRVPLHPPLFRRVRRRSSAPAASTSGP